MQNWLASLPDIIKAIADEPEGKRYFYPIRHGTMRVGIYAPQGTDPQQPHDQDELYIVESGSGVFLNGDERRQFKPGDVIFVPAGAVHRFEDFSDDFRTWVVFWGLQGGEA